MKSPVYSNRGFTLVEMIVVIAIIGIVAAAAFTLINFESARDTNRKAALTTVTSLLEDFYSTYGEYPNPTGNGRKYPKTGCNVSGWQGLIDCFVSNGSVVKDSETYEKIAHDPSEGTTAPDTEMQFFYYYCSNQKGNKFRIYAVAGKQEDTTLLGVDGNVAEKGKRVLTYTSRNTKPSEVTNCGK